MTKVEFVGLALSGVSGWVLRNAHMTDTIARTWPLAPLRRTDNKQEFRIALGVMWAALVLGLGLLLAAALKRLGL